MIFLKQTQSTVFSIYKPRKNLLNTENLNASRSNQLNCKGCLACYPLPCQWHRRTDESMGSVMENRKWALRKHMFSHSSSQMLSKSCRSQPHSAKQKKINHHKNKKENKTTIIWAPLLNKSNTILICGRLPFQADSIRCFLTTSLTMPQSMSIALSQGVYFNKHTH